MSNKLQEDRQLYMLIAKPIENYLSRQGLDPIQHLALISGLATEVFENLQSHLEVKPKGKP